METNNSYIERISESNIDFTEELFPILENINKDNINKLLKSLETSVSNGWVGEASELSDSLLNSSIVQNNPKILVNIHLERMKKYQYFQLLNLAKQTSLKVIKLLEVNSSHFDKDTDTFDMWRFTATSQLGWNERDLLELKRIIEQGASISSQSSNNNQKVMNAFLTGLTGRKFLMEGKILEGKTCFYNSISQLSEMQYFRAAAHLRVYFAECIFEYSSVQDSYQLALEILNENEIRMFKSHLVLRVFILLIKSNLTDSEKKQKHILNLQMLMYAMGLGQSQKVYPLVKSAFELIPNNKKIDFFKIDFRIWLDHTIRGMSWEEYESLIVRYYKDRRYSFVEKLPDNFPVFDILAKGEYNGNELVTLIQTKHWKTKVTINDIPDGFRFEQAFEKLNKKYNISSIDFIKYYSLSGMTMDADEKIRRNAEKFINAYVKVDIISRNDEIINFYEQSPSKVINLFIDNF